MKKIIFLAFSICMVTFCFSIPKYEGGLQLRGIQILPDHEDSNAYYYIPAYPRMATNPDGSYEFMFMKYVGKGSQGANGGIFHALIEFTLPADEVQKLQDTLRLVVKNNNARIVGPVPLQQVMKDGENGLASFQVVSSILNNTPGANPFTQTIITSGHAPFLPGSKAAIAARLSQEGATLLWESMQGKTSDVSVMINGYYEAYVKAYQASITAEVNTVYEHYSRIFSFQDGFTKDQLRKITDELVQNQALNIESFDRTSSLDIKADEMKGLLDLITNKLVELMFDAKAGWMQTPTREVAVEPDQIKGRQEAGFFSQLFSGTGNQPYFSDNQFVLKKRTDIRTNTFYLNLSQASTIKVPVYTSGNLGGLYDAMKEKGPQVEKYFHIVNMDDPVFQKREIAFMLDGGFAESFNDIFNLVTVNFRKRYPNGQSDVTGELLFTRKNFENATGAVFQSVGYPRMGETADDWLQYEYRISWNLKGQDKTIKFPANDNEWIKTTDPGLTLMPPLKKRKISVEVDRALLSDTSVSTVVVKFMVILGGQPGIQKTLVLRSKDPANVQEFALFHDNNEPVAYQVIKHTSSGEQRGPLKELKDDFLMISKN